MTDFRAFEAERIRYLLLKELAAQETASWTLTMLVRAIKVAGYPKSPEYLLNQLRWLEREVMAVKLVPAGAEYAVQLRSAGRRHVDRVQPLVGVDLPDED